MPEKVKIYWPEKISNIKLRERAEMDKRKRKVSDSVL